MTIKKQPASAAIAALALLGSAPAFGGEAIEFDNGMKLGWKATTTYTLGTRLENPDPLLARNAGANDGDNNFKKGALTANRLALLLEANLSKDDTGFVMSASTFYDDVYHRSNDNTGPVNKQGAVNEFSDQAKRYHGGYSRILDAYAYTSFKLGETSSANLRVGRQVVSWGESLFFPGIALAQGPADGTKTGVAGTETKDQLLPEDQISAIIELTPRWSLLGQAQFNFHETIAPAPGSYLNSSDGVGPGGTCLNPYVNNKCTFGLRGADILPSKTGQWGVGTHYRLTNETELGLYYLNYQDRVPLPEINAFTPGGSYNIRYFDNIKLTGASFSTTFGKATLAGELSYKQGAPVLVDTVVNPGTRATIPNPTRADVTQLNVNTMINVGRTPFADMVTVLGEVSAVSISNVQARKAPGVEALGRGAAFFPASDKLSFTSTGVAISGTVVLDYPSFSENWALSVPISYAQQLHGRTLVGGVGGEGDKRLSVGATFTYKQNLQVGLTYNGYFGSANTSLVSNRLLTDRDQLSAMMKYTF